MWNKKTPFEITNNMIHKVAEISELVGRLASSNHLSVNPTLHRTNRIQAIYGSLDIEQNTLSLGAGHGCIERQTGPGSTQGYCWVQECL